MALCTTTDFDFGLDETTNAVREQVRRFAQEIIAPRAADIDRDNQFPPEFWPLLGDQGLLLF